jgi:hypothetical protein
VTDLRDLLDAGAGRSPRTVPDLARITARGRAVSRHRRIVAAACAAAVTVTLLGTWTRLPLNNSAPAKDDRVTVVGVGTLAPGTYIADSLHPAVRFTVPDTLSWRVVAQTPAGLTLISDDGHAAVHLQHWTGVVQPGADALQAGAVHAVPADLISWLAAHPDLRLQTPPEETSLARHPARRVAFTIRAQKAPAAQRAGCNWNTQCVVLGVSDEQAVSAPEGALTEITVPDGSGNGLILTVAIASDRLAAKTLVRGLTDSFAES